VSLRPDSAQAGPVRPGPETSPHRRELLAFAAVGLLAYALDLGLFTWLRGPAGLGPLTAKALSFLAGCSVAYVGHACATYAGRAAAPFAGGRLRQFVLFVAVNLAGALVQLLCLAVAHYGLGLTSQRADTVSGAGVGMALATLLRFWGTRTWVFRAHPVTDRPPRHGTRANMGRGASWTG
jgi:putative flippase GtrA